MIRFFDNNQLAKADAARTNSIKSGKMLATRDTTDAIRHEGRGLKRWGGQRAALSSLGFQKLSSNKLKFVLNLSNHAIDRYYKRVLKVYNMKPTQKVQAASQKLRRSKVFVDLMNRMNNREMANLNFLMMGGKKRKGLIIAPFDKNKSLVMQGNHVKTVLGKGQTGSNYKRKKGK